jgi:hypothetical protein
MVGKRLPAFPPPSFVRRARALEKATPSKPGPIPTPHTSYSVCPTCRKPLEWTDWTGDKIVYRCTNLDCPTLIVYVVCV